MFFGAVSSRPQAHTHPPSCNKLRRARAATRLTLPRVERSIVRRLRFSKVDSCDNRAERYHPSPIPAARSSDFARRFARVNRSLVVSRVFESFIATYAAIMSRETPQNILECRGSARVFTVFQVRNINILFITHTDVYKHLVSLA